jgi:hypothetical protein
MSEQEKADLLCRVDFPLYSASMVGIGITKLIMIKALKFH